ncbi:hypothetical protein BDM02DRAFT_3122663, partial [Thelephora ganbajun]
MLPGSRYPASVFTAHRIAAADPLQAIAVPPIVITSMFSLNFIRLRLTSMIHLYNAG